MLDGDRVDHDPGEVCARRHRHPLGRDVIPVLGTDDDTALTVEPSR
jgi:hypothetical protein